ncbi:double zinc ribbon and ankyrin repeat-containing protein 1-like isoform X2 [Amphiura filiformis]|uniref:double zinc ribbon and ankyrin repeat-containing protein 1-like isoform X2 n=1 Tax=Amphiura filiformis TaxID=82378 RepID=UPI003B20B754
MAAGAVAVPSIIPLRVPIPGKNKSEIDTNTLIELKTEFPDTRIYYTLNGTKPDPFQQLVGRTTMQYKKPFLLPEGRWTVKTLAITNDNRRESAVGSKTFLVDFVPGPAGGHTSDDESMPSSRSTDGILKTRPSSAKASHYRKPTTGTRFMETRMGTKTASTTAGHKNRKEKLSRQASEDNKKPPETLTQTNRLQRQTDFLKCVFCNADRPADPFARFCIACGNPVPPLPNTRLPPPEPAQLGMCVGCNSMIPLNVEKCLVCEMPIPPQLIPQASIQAKDKLICRECGTANPANMDYCVTCEQRLTGANRHLRSTHSGSVGPPSPSKGGRLLCCNKCGRVNNSDARYCDWCGAKPAPTISLLNCSKCRATNQAYSTFCHSCGCMIGAPPRADPRNNGITVGGRSTSQVIDKAEGSASWVPMSMPAPPPEMETVGTQTVGLFFKSTKGLALEEKVKEDQKALQETMSDKKPVLTAISPGKGYWRQQMDHICGHLKAYAQNNQDFRNLIGEPRMGKMTAATVHEDGYEMNLNALFNLRGPKDAFTGKPMGISKGLSNLTEGRKSGLTGSTSSLDSVGHTTKLDKTSTGGSKTTTPKKKKPKKRVEEKLTPAEKDLLREVGPKGDGDAEEVERLLDEGASAKVENPDGIPVLMVAVMNKHFECLDALVNAGADIDKRAGSKNNTALHEAVSLGPSGKEGVTKLLSLGASTKIKNNKDETAYSQASREGHETVIAAFASTAGQGMLNKLMRQTSKITLDDDGF